MTAAAPTQTRRDVMIAMAMTSIASACGPVFASKQISTAPEHDWDWLIGNWDVRHRRLKERLAGSNEWQEFGGKSVLWLAMNGLGTVDDNIVELPNDTYRGLTVRAFDSKTRQWSIWWLDGRTARVDPPVIGKFDGDSGTFVGNDQLRGKPIVMRFRWLDIHSSRPHWEQAFSPDGGKTWEVNWENFFTRTSAKPTSLPRLENAPRDLDFLAGTWHASNRRLKQRLIGSTQWEEFDNSLVNWPVLGGFGNVGDNTFHAPNGTFRGMSLRTYNQDTREWLSWWIDDRNPTHLEPPERGTFKDGVGTFAGDEVWNGKPVKVRSQWSRITPTTAHWEQAASGDGGRTWETNWISELTRKA